MISIRRLIVAMAGLLLGMNAYAGQDPIGWSQQGSIPTTSHLNHSYAVSFTMINNLPFTMPTPLMISNNSNPVNQVVMTDGCSGLKLAKNQTCQVGLVLTPKTAGVKTMSIDLEYGSNKVPIPRVPLTTTTPEDSNSGIVGTPIGPFPSAILSNTTYSISFQFTNKTGSALSNVILSQNAGNTNGFTQTSTTCTSTLVDSCTVSGNFTTTATSGSVTVGYTLSSGSVSGEATTATIISNTSGASVRTLTFVNNCSQTVWFGFVSGSVKPGPASCKTTADCDEHSICLPSANKGAGLCFYPNPVPASGSYALAPSGGTTTVKLTDYKNLPFVWSGNIAGRTNCLSGTCDTGDCGGGTGACPIGSGFTQPATLSEPTFQRNTVDNYDVSILNGTNIGMSVTPTTTSSFGPNYNQTGFPYYCQIPGKTTAVPALHLGACNWTSGFTPPAFPNSDSATSYVYVKPASLPLPATPQCTTHSDCTVAPNTTCGLAFDKAATKMQKVCGQFLGYNTANQMCSYANTNTVVANITAANPANTWFNCDSAITGNADLAAFTNFSMYSCQAGLGGANNFATCYNSSATPDCCGAVNWWQVSPTIQVPDNTQGGTAYTSTNSAWGVLGGGGLVLPGIEWIKRACPTAYAYPFDDLASSFICDDISNSKPTNTVNYTFTFCPT